MSTVDEVIRAMQRDAAIVDIDAEFAHLMARMDSSAGASLAVASALVSAASMRGDTGIGRAELAAMAGAWLGDGEAALVALDGSVVCGDGTSATPMVMDAGRIYLYRYWDYECRLAAALRSRDHAAADAPSPAVLGGLLDRLFPAVEAPLDWQKVAAALAMLRTLSIVSGGPGTGKTSTMARVLAMAIECLGSDCRIALAAPTGKAAARMQQAVSVARLALDVDDAVGGAIPTEAFTLHRLLGARGAGGFRHDADNPLAVDLLVVDEVSMVDLALMTRLVEAVPAGARLVLLGDRDQLASVEPGSVFADLCADAGGFSESLAAALSEAAGQVVDAGAATALSDACVLLRRNYRFGDDSGIGALSGAVRDGDARRALTLLGDPGVADLQWREEGGGVSVDETLTADLMPAYRECIDAVRGGAAPAAVFEHYRRLQVLCAVRAGPRGVDGLNRRIERALAADGLIDADDPWYAGRPLMVTRNDYGLGLFNGDPGVLLPVASDGETRACFLREGAEPRWIHPARLPPHDTAWAMTVHKAQGSEFDHVVIVFPDHDSPILSREWLYTAVSRARRRVEVRAAREWLAAAIGRRVQRQGALARRLVT